MKINIKQIFTYLFILIPIFLITGPAIPDLIITFGTIFGMSWLIIMEKNNDLFKQKFIRVSLIFWISLIFISFFSFNKINSFQDSIIFLRYLLIPICCYYFFFINDKMLNYLLLTIFLAVIFVSIDSLYQFFNYTSKNGFGKDLIGFESNWYGRLTGPFGDELVPGSYLSKFGLLGYAYLLYNKKFTRIKFAHTIYLATILVVCFASGERMALATFSLALIILLVFLKNYRVTVLASCIFGLLFIFAIYKYHPFYNDFEVIESNEFHQGLKVEKKFKCEEDKNKVCSKIIDIQPNFFKIIKNFDTSAYGEIYLLSYKMFVNNPITGIGINNFQYLCNQIDEYNKLMINYSCASHPHNTYIQWLAEGGLIVFLTFLIYLITIILIIQKNSGEQKFKILSIVVLIILFWPIMSTGSLIKNWYGILVYFIIGICLCLSRLKINSNYRF